MRRVDTCAQRYVLARTHALHVFTLAVCCHLLHSQSEKHRPLYLIWCSKTTGMTNSRNVCRPECVFTCIRLQGWQNSQQGDSPSGAPLQSWCFRGLVQRESPAYEGFVTCSPRSSVLQAPSSGLGRHLLYLGTHIHVHTCTGLGGRTISNIRLGTKYAGQTCSTVALYANTIESNSVACMYMVSQPRDFSRDCLEFGAQPIGAHTCTPGKAEAASWLMA